MQRFPIARRGLLQVAAAMVGVSAATRTAQAAGVCVPANSPDASLRASLHYVEASPDKDKRCGLCAFFTEPKDDCGKCQIFSGPASANGRCDSFAPKG